MFVYTVKLDANLSHHKELEKRFRMADDIYQKTLREILKRVRKQKKDPRYKQAYKLPKGQERNDILKELMSNTIYKENLHLVNLQTITAMHETIRAISQVMLPISWVTEHGKLILVSNSLKVHIISI